MGADLLRALSRLAGTHQHHVPDPPRKTSAVPTADAAAVAAKFLAEITSDPAFKLTHPQRLAQPQGE
jgi:hypothetical protein